MLFAGITLPTPHAASGAASQGPIDGTIALILLSPLIVLAFAFFCLGAGELYDWFQIRGWRPKHLRRPLK